MSIDLPGVSNPPGHPRATGRADYTAAKGKQPAYVVRHPMNTARLGHITKIADRTLYRVQTGHYSGHRLYLEPERKVTECLPFMAHR